MFCPRLVSRGPRSWPRVRKPSSRLRAVCRRLLCYARDIFCSLVSFVSFPSLYSLPDSRAYMLPKARRNRDSQKGAQKKCLISVVSLINIDASLNSVSPVRTLLRALSFFESESGYLIVTARIKAKGLRRDHVQKGSAGAEIKIKTKTSMIFALRKLRLMAVRQHPCNDQPRAGSITCIFTSFDDEMGRILMVFL